jgi:hypothetical protein
MHVPPFMLFSKELQGLELGETATTLRVMFQDEIHEELADNHANLSGVTWVSTGMAAATLIHSHIRWPF